MWERAKCCFWTRAEKHFFNFQIGILPSGKRSRKESSVTASLLLFLRTKSDTSHPDCTENIWAVWNICPSSLLPAATALSKWFKLTLNNPLALRAKRHLLQTLSRPYVIMCCSIHVGRTAISPHKMLQKWLIATKQFQNDYIETPLWAPLCWPLKDCHMTFSSCMLSAVRCYLGSLTFELTVRQGCHTYDAVLKNADMKYMFDLK